VVRQSFRFRVLEEEEGFRVGRWVLLVLTGRVVVGFVQMRKQVRDGMQVDTRGSLEHVISPAEFNLE